MKLFAEISEADISRKYLASRGLVAIERDLAESFAAIDGGTGNVMYCPGDDTYRRLPPERQVASAR